MIRLFLLGVIFLITYKHAHSQDCPTECAYFIPNSLTPDCDELDCGLLEIATSCTFIEFRLTIYNRWAEQVFYSEDPHLKFNSSDQEQGTYVWKLDGLFCNQFQINDTGYLVIVR